MTRPGESFGAEPHEDGLRAAQDLLCGRPEVFAIAHPGEHDDVPVAHVYMLDDNGNVWAGTMWRPDRLPTVDEISAALTRWRGASGPTWRVSYWTEANDQSPRDAQAGLM